MKSPVRFNIKSGYTLIEVLIVVAIVAVVVGMSMVIGFNAVPQTNVASERDLLVSYLISARGRAIANVDQKAQGVRVTPTTLVIFEGSVYASSSSNRTITRTSNITIKDQTGTTTFDTIFKQLSADLLTSTSTITLSESGTDDQIVTVNQFGGLDW